MRLTDEMKEMVERLRLCYVATVTPDGKPNLSPKGSLKVWDDETVVFADIASPGTIVVHNGTVARGLVARLEMWRGGPLLIEHRADERQDG